MSDWQFEEEEFHTSTNVGTLGRILRLLIPHKWMALGFMVAIGAVAFIEAALTFIGAQIIDQGIIARNPQRIVELVVTYALMMFVLAFGVFVFIYLAGKLGQRVTYDLRKAMFDHLQTLSLTYYNKTPVGWIMSRVNSDSERIADLVSWGLLDVIWAVMNIVTALIFMFSINWQLALAILPLIPSLWFAALWFKARILLHYRESRKYNSEIIGAYNEMITGVRVIKALNREATSLEEFGDLTRSMYRASYKAAWYSALFLPTVQIMSSLAVGAILVLGGQQIVGLTGEALGLTIGGLNAFIGYVTFMMWPVQDLARVYASMQHAIASAERAFSLLDTKPDIVDRPCAVEVDSIEGDIVFEDVTFYYDADKPVLTNFSLKVKAGETVALVGHTGSGKSTIVNLICRFYEPRAGRILINGRDYREIALHSLHSKIGMVLQTPHLFSGTIRDNIRYGRLEATDAQIEAAARTAGAHDFIATLEKGYDTEVGEGGVLLSTGQKQLISIARAILAEPQLFIMDEATSSVDTLTEALIQKGMETLMEGRTSFVIAHRLSTIKNADRIVVLENGKIIEMGTHSELLRQRGHYYSLYTKQFRREREAELERALEMA
ncbi:MAG: ABC transporter ATP-binding protein/permease [Anaerolineae bacterium]|nr:ABC transporter ATP-binding protein/permease [Anaerolineae bacterium]MDW8170884.1 ABC transporter ATP-binding protein [Anaerolineae bacterium]